jgi:hypothetical protein
LEEVTAGQPVKPGQVWKYVDKEGIQGLMDEWAGRRRSITALPGWAIVPLIDLTVVLGSWLLFIQISPNPLPIRAQTTFFQFSGVVAL